MRRVPLVSEILVPSLLYQGTIKVPVQATKFNTRAKAILFEELTIFGVDTFLDSDDCHENEF